MNKFSIIGSALGVLLCSGCDDKRSEPGDPVSEVTARAAAVTTGAATPAPPATRPRTKPFRETETARLGTLPEGIGVRVGQAIAQLSAKDSDGKNFDLQEALKTSPVLVMFYRGGWCPFCNFQVRQMTESFPEFKKRGVTPVLVSVDRVSEAAKTRNSYEIPFPVLSDPELRWHKSFQVINRLDGTVVEKLRGSGMDVEASSGETHHTVAIPSVFLISQAGKVLFAHADHDYKVRPGAPALLAAVDAALKL